MEENEAAEEFVLKSGLETENVLLAFICIKDHKR